MTKRNRHELWVMDVFTTELYRGNAAAVVFDASDLSAEAMQAIAQEMNLSETAFVLPPTDSLAHYRVRFFTPRSELPFAGHPTIAVAAAITAHDERLAKWLPGVLRQECALGLIPVEASHTEGGGYEFTMTQAAPSYRDVLLAREIAGQMLGCILADLSELPMRVVSTGVPWLIVPLVSPAAVAAAKPVFSLLERICDEHAALGVTIFAVGAAGAQKWIKVRTFAPGQGIAEDPVCGSANGSVAAYIAVTGLFDGPDFHCISHQGAEVARAGHVSIHCDAGSVDLRVRIGGQAVISLQGCIHS